tara:strand:- start:607 stop:1872 length:1266 start_codon:yes stop_codon:yes gene_type:complete
MECPICYQDKGLEDFYEISLGIVGEESDFSCLVTDGCKECIKTEDIKISPRNPRVKFTYEILNRAKYQEIKIKNYLKEVLDFEGEFLGIGDVTEICLENGLIESKHAEKYLNKELSSKEIASSRLTKRAKERIENQNKKDPRYPVFHKVPRFGYDYPNKNGKSYINIMMKADMDKFLDLQEKDSQWSRWAYSKKSTISKEKALELEMKGFIMIGKTGDIAFRWDKQKELKPCRYCGEVYNIDEFQQVGTREKGWHSCKCKKCVTKDSFERYHSMTEEEKEVHIESVLQWRKENRDKVRAYAKNPRQRMFKSVRRRLKDFMRTKDQNYSKDVGKTKKELVEYLESLWVDGMSWDNYGAGEDFKHEGVWHIDHRIPLSKWDSDKHLLPEYFEGMSPNHYFNLQPLWGKENISKSNKVDLEHII